MYANARLTALCPGLLRWASTRKVKPSWTLLKQERVSGRGISWAVCKSAPRSRQITTPVLHHSVFYRMDALPTTQPTASKHWRHTMYAYVKEIFLQRQTKRWLIHSTVYVHRSKTNLKIPSVTTPLSRRISSDSVVCIHGNCRSGNRSRCSAITSGNELPNIDGV